MVTPTYSLTAIERVLPRMALDFTTGVLDPRVTVGRALDTATRVNSSGYIETINANLPRFDYDPITLELKGLLIEETRANLVPNSTAGTSWGLSAGGITNNNITSPRNLLDGDTFTADGTSSRHYISRGNVGTAGTTRTVSLFLRKGTGSYVQMMFGADVNAYVNFDLDLGVVGTNGSAASGTIQPFQNGWYRCTLTTSSTTATTDWFVLAVTAANAARFELNSLNTSFGFWGAQGENGAFATSFILTTATSLTRNADVVSMTGTNFSSWWQNTTGGLLVSARQSTITGTRPWAYISDGTANNIISLRGNANNPELYIKATTDQAQIDAGTIAANTQYKLVGAWNTNNCAAAINGGAAITDTSATIPTVDRMLIGSDGTNYLSGWAEKIQFWPQRITDAEVQAFSK